MMAFLAPVFAWFTDNKWAGYVVAGLALLAGLKLRDNRLESIHRADERRKADERARKHIAKAEAEAAKLLKEFQDEQDRKTEAAREAREEARTDIVDDGGWTDAASVSDPVAHDILFGTGAPHRRSGRGRRDG